MISVCNNLMRSEERRLDSKEMGLLMNNYIRIAEFKAIIENKFGKRIDDIEWQSVLEEYKIKMHDLIN